MRWKTTLALGLLFVALAVFYYVWEVRLAPEREKAAQARGRLWDVAAKDVQEVVLTRKGDTVRLAREAGQWALLAPVRSRADARAADELVTSLTMARVDREIAADPAGLQEFGLEVPAAEVALTVQGKPEPLTLLLGSRSPTGAWVYAKAKDTPAVFTLSDLLLREATRPAADFRDRAILAFEREEVSGLEIAVGGVRMAVEADGQGRWTIRRPRALGADARAIADLLDKLRVSRVREFVADAPRSLAPYGLDRPSRVTVYVGKEKDRAARTLLFGRADAARAGVYAMRQGEAAVLLLGEDVWQVVPKTVGALRDKTVLDYAREGVVRLELESPKGRVALAREGEKWRLTAPEPLPADDAEVRTLLWKTRDMRAAGFLGEGAEAVGRLLGRAQVRLSLWEEGAETPKVLLLSPSPDRRGGRAMAYAGVVGRGPVMLVDAEYLTDLARSALDLRDRTLLAGLDVLEVGKLRATRDGQSVALERRGASWRLTEPKGGAARDERVTDLLYLARGLRWRELVSPGGEEAARYGLDAPAFELALFKADGTEVARLVLGRTEGDRVFARTGASPAIFALEKKHLEGLPKLPDDLQR
jgi:hypothetical protein